MFFVISKRLKYLSREPLNELEIFLFNRRVIAPFNFIFILRDERVVEKFEIEFSSREVKTYSYFSKLLSATDS